MKIKPYMRPGSPGYRVTFFHPVLKKRITRGLQTRDKWQAVVTCRALETFATNPEKYSNFTERGKLDAVARNIFYQDNIKTNLSFDDIYGDGPKSAVMKRVLSQFPNGETPDYFEPALVQGLARAAVVLTNRGASRKELADFEKTISLLFFILEDNAEIIAAHQRAREALRIELAEAYEPSAFDKVLRLAFEDVLLSAEKKDDGAELSKTLRLAFENALLAWGEKAKGEKK